MKKTKDVIAKRIYELSQRIKGDQDEMAELREALAAKMKPGQLVPFDTPEGPYQAKLCECSETILHGNAIIIAEIGLEMFTGAAKVSLTDLKAVLFGSLPQEVANRSLTACTKATVTKTTLKILKGRER